MVSREHSQREFGYERLDEQHSPQLVHECGMMLQAMQFSFYGADNFQAFKKTERKVAGDETKKSTEWVLEDFAIKDGVQSTTRYRKGTNAKKFMKTDTPAPARQISGRRGGLAPRDNRHLKQRFKERSVSRRPSPCVGITNNMQYHRGPHPAPQRQRSPLTPPHPEHIFSSSPCFFPKPEQFDMPFEEMCGLEVVQGVYIDDGPLFSDDQDAPFHGGHPMSNHPY
jgi:hypothetical protein